MAKMKSKFIKWSAEWCATVLTMLPYTDRRSLMVDKLIKLAERKN